MKTFSLRKVASLVTDAGFPAYVEMTGGNCGTILVGEADAEGFTQLLVAQDRFLMTLVGMKSSISVAMGMKVDSISTITILSGLRNQLREQSSTHTRFIYRKRLVA